MRAVVTEPDPVVAEGVCWLRWGSSNDINAGGMVVGSVAEGGGWLARYCRRCVTSS